MRRYLLALALALLCAIPASAEVRFPIVRETGVDTIYVHVIAGPSWFGQEERIEGHRVEVRDADGRVLIWATTTAQGDANMHTPLPDVVMVWLDTGQTVTVARGDGPLAVAVWVGHRASVAASWPTLVDR